MRSLRYKNNLVASWFIANAAKSKNTATKGKKKEFFLMP
jgi:hypothetical protein